MNTMYDAVMKMEQLLGVYERLIDDLAGYMKENGIDYTHVRTYLRQVNMALLADKHYSSIQIYFDVDPV